MQSSRWQLEASVPEKKFEEYLKETKEKHEGGRPSENRSHDVTALANSGE
jgi:predicted acetyltransferase